MSEKNQASIRRRFIATAAATALVASGLLVGGAAGASAKPVIGGTLYFITHSENFNHADPGRNYTGQDLAFFNSYLQRNLVMYKPVAGAAGSSLVGDLATNSGIPSKSAKVWKFTLRPGVLWEDGTKITCADVKYGTSRTFATDVITDGPSYARDYLNIPTNADGTSQYAGPYKKTGQALFNKAVTCSKDNRTVTFNLKRSVSDFNYATSYPLFGPVKASKDTGDKYDLNPQSSGPYKIAKYTFNGEMNLVRNAKWSKASDPIRTPYPDNITVRFGLNEDVRDQIMLNDQIPNTINLDGLQPVNNQTFFNNPATAVRGMNKYDVYVRYYAMNVSPGFLDCLDIRKAIFYAWNVQSLIDLAGGIKFYGVPGDGPIKPVLGLDYAPTKGNIHDPNYKLDGNVAYAKSFLDKAKVSCPALYARVTDPTKGIVIDTTNGSGAKKAAVLINSALKLAGIAVNFNFLPAGSFYSIVQDPTKSHDMARVGWGQDWANASTVIPPLFIKGSDFALSKAWNDPNYPAFKALADKAGAETNRLKQAAMWKQLSQIVMDNVWISTPIFSKSQFEWGSKVGGVAFWDPQGTFVFPALYVK